MTQNRTLELFNPNGLAVILGWLLLSTPAFENNISQQASGSDLYFQRCGSGIRDYCVVDGDTIWFNGIKMRIADIDTPEVTKPHCAAEKALGDRAATRLLELVNAAPFQIQAWPKHDEDRYGRKLRVLVRGGRSIGDVLVSEGLARTWIGKRQPWC